MDSIIANSDSEKEVIIKLLLARGFLIEVGNNSYLLSDNSHPSDKEYLKTMLLSYHFGMIENGEIIITGTDYSENEGHLTDLGFKMLEIGKKYGSNSEAFMNALGYLILVNGKHLELIKHFEMFQRKASDPISDKSKEFLLDVEKYLTTKGCIGSRKPSAVKTDAKATYIRDEPKLWNKFDILQKATKSDYFFKNEGYKFDWHKISDILISGSQLLNE